MVKKVKKKPDKKKGKKSPKEKKKFARDLKTDSNKPELVEEIKEIKEDSKPIKTIDENEFTEILQQQIVSSVPVLERVADADDQRNLEQELAAIQLPSREEEEEKEINYSTTSSDYISTNTIGRGSENRSQYESTSTGYSPMFQDNEEQEETKRAMGQGDFTQRNENNRTEIERPGSIKEDEKSRETRKYMSKGDYK